MSHPHSAGTRLVIRGCHCSDCGRALALLFSSEMGVRSCNVHALLGCISSPVEKS